MTRDEMVSYVLDRTLVSGGDQTRVGMIVAMLKQAHTRLVVELGLKQVFSDVELNGSGSTTPAFTSGESVITLPSDFARIRSLYMDRAPLVEVSWRDLLQLINGQETTRAQFAMQGFSQVRIYPAPTDAQAETLMLAYDASPTEMSAGTSIPDAVPDGYHEILPELVIHRVMLGEEEPGLAAAAKANADEMRMMLQTVINRRGGNGPVQIPMPGLDLR